MAIARAVNIIASHAAAAAAGTTVKSLFLFYASHSPHAPLQAPADLVARFASIDSKNRRVYTAQVHVAMGESVILKVLISTERAQIIIHTVIMLW
jgi:hypothetical protein